MADDYQYTYDAAGNKTKIQRNKFNNELAVIFDETEGLTKYKYNRLNQLTEVTKPNKTTEKYFYDTVGNRVRKENWVCSTFIDASDYQYDLQNRLTNINIQGIQMPCKKPLNQSITMEYDQRGNLIKITNGNRVLNQYTFDTANRLSEATNVLGIKTNFNYDGAGRRTKMQITLPKPPKCFQPGLSSLFNSKNQANEKDISSWLYNGKDHKVEYNYVLDITEPYENVLMIYGKGIDTQRYTYGLDVLSLDTWNKSLSTWNQNCAKAITAKKADRSYYLQDELGSPIRIIGEAGNTKARYSYDAFGKPIIPVNLISRCKTKGNIYSYTGYQYDLSTGLMYAQARYYMPEVGRFISADTYKGTVTDPQSLNLYVYCRNNPVNYVDPSGNWPEPTDVTRTLAKWLIGNPINVYATQQGWFKDQFYAAGFFRNSGGVYHARQDCLQQHGGYNDFYDSVFHYATSMDKAKFQFSMDGKDYMFWAWKGDYLNLGSGAEMGIYTRMVIKGTATDHWLVDTSLAMPMTLTLKGNKGNTIVNYNPSEKQWWITGFNPYCQDVQASNLTATYTINFSGNKDMYNEFYNEWNGVDKRWIFNPKKYTATFTF